MLVIGDDKTMTFGIKPPVAEPQHSRNVFTAVKTLSISMIFKKETKKSMEVMKRGNILINIIEIW